MFWLWGKSSHGISGFMKVELNSSVFTWVAYKWMCKDLAQCCPTVACCGNGFIAGCSQAGAILSTSEGGSPLRLCVNLWLCQEEAKCTWIWSYLLCNLLSRTWLFPSHTQIHFLSESQGCGWAVLWSGEPCAPPGSLEGTARCGQLLLLPWTFRGGCHVPWIRKILWNGDLGRSLCHLENCHPSLIFVLFCLIFKIYAYLCVCVHMTICHVCGALRGQRGYQVLSSWSSVL